MNHKPVKITVATVTYNAVSVLQRTLDSVAAQNYAHVEHLIIDGNSHDGTLALFQHYQANNSRAGVIHEVNAISEPDRGIYDAMNKALAWPRVTISCSSTPATCSTAPTCSPA